MPVLGMGGLFFRARDPDALAAWYKTYLNVGTGCSADPGAEEDGWSWITLGGPVVFQPFTATTDYFAADKQWMLNLRVSEIDALIASLTNAGIEVETRPDWDSPQTGRFARVHDPEGNAVELWQPPGH